MTTKATTAGAGHKAERAEAGPRGAASPNEVLAPEKIASAMNAVLADVFSLYVKTKNFHWHMTGPHFRDYHKLLDQQSDQLFEMTDPIAERVRKIGQPTVRSIGQIARLQRVHDSDADDLDPADMLKELRDDNAALAGRLRAAHDVCDANRDVATASLIEVWIDETERRAWFLSEIVHDSANTHH